ncbi:hypothetical protein D3C76_1214070 [compost metagenome]
MLRVEVGQAGTEQLRLGGGHQQLFRAIDGHALLECRVELDQLVLVDVGKGRDPGKVQAVIDRHRFEVRFVGDRGEIDTIGFWRGHHLRQCQQLGYVVAGFLWQRQVPVVGRQAEPFVALDGSADGAFAGIVGRQGQQPVAVEHVVQAGQVVQRSIGRRGDIAAAIVEVGLAQVEVAACRWHELPHAGSAGA